MTERGSGRQPGEVFRTKTGKILSDEDFERLADEAEVGYDVGHLVERKREREKREPDKR